MEISLKVNAKNSNTTYRNPVFFEALFSLLQTIQCSAFNNMTNEICMIQYTFCKVYIKATIIGEVRGHLVASKIFNAFL